jgi:hypothetical protein
MSLSAQQFTPLNVRNLRAGSPERRSTLASYRSQPFHETSESVTEGSLNAYQRAQVSTEGAHQANSMQHALDDAPKQAAGTD